MMSAHRLGLSPMRVLGMTLALTAVGLSGAFAADPVRVGAVMYARDSQYWQQIERGMQDAAKTLGVELQVTVSNRQLPTEAQVIEDLLTRGINVLLVSPLDKDASSKAIRQAADRNVAVI